MSGADRGVLIWLCGVGLALAVFGMMCSVALHQQQKWVTEDVVAPVLFAILIWPLSVVTVSIYYSIRTLHAGIGVLVKSRATPVVDASLHEAQEEVERLLKESP